ncbi:hypothetical protein PLESTF_000470500 [Pleodorina starrii]|nr:hypothetical protein PLESTF_000470500 [Pleodorina starrii]
MKPSPQPTLALSPQPSLAPSPQPTLAASDQTNQADEASCRSMTACDSAASLASSASTFTLSSMHTTPSLGALSNFSASSSLSSAPSSSQAKPKTAGQTPKAANPKAAPPPPPPRAAAQQQRPRLTVPLQPAVLGLDELQVLVVQLADVDASHREWLLQGWAMTTAAAATGGTSQPLHPLIKGRGKQQQLQLQRQRDQQLPKVIGFDTEFIGDQLALVQLCCGGRALLIRVPEQRQNAKKATTNSSSGSSSAAAKPATTGSRGRRAGVGSRGKVGAGDEGEPQHPFVWPSALEEEICDPSIPKAAAEAWQDAIMLFAAFGIKLRNGLDLTVACPPPEEDRKRGRKKLPLFDIFAGLFPDARLSKDKTIDHSLWFSAALSENQIKYGALDAFVSYAAGVRLLQNTTDTAAGAAGAAAQPLAELLPPPVDLTLPTHSEVLLATQWVLTSQFQEAGAQKRTQHDFCSAQFEMRKNQGLVLVVHMSRFKTRLRRFCWVEVRLLPDGRRLSGKCVFQRGKTAHVANLRWVGGAGGGGGGGGGGREVRREDVSDKIQSIEMEEMRDTPEEAATKELLVEVLCGAKSLLSGARLAAGIFGGGSLLLAPPAAASARSRVLSEVAALHAAGRVNESQREAVEAILCGDRSVQLVQGPPGTGKTTVISHTVEMWVRLLAPGLPPLPGAGRHVEAMACVARSNVAAKNIALALLKRGLGPQEFRLVVSEEYHFEWHEEQYRGRLQDVLITSDELRGEDISRRLEGVRVFVTTLSMLASKRFRSAALYGKELTRLMVDEASQIFAGDMVLPLHLYGKHLRSLSLFGDDLQLPPYGSDWDGAQLHSLFDHLSPPADRAAARMRPQPNAFCVGPALTPPRGAQAATTAAAAGGGVSGTAAACRGGGGDGAHRVMLSVSYRLPPPLCRFISRELYGGALRSGRTLDGAAGSSAMPSILWVNVEGKEERGAGSSFKNAEEVSAVARLVRRDFGGNGNWTVITGYDLQRTVLGKELARCGGGPTGGGGRADGDRVYNIDTFQGREDEVVIASLVRSGTSLGFMEDDRRVNVMLTRCTRHLVVVGRLQLALSHPATLIGRMAAHCVAEGLVERPAAAGAAGAAAAAAWGGVERELARPARAASTTSSSSVGPSRSTTTTTTTTATSGSSCCSGQVGGSGSGRSTVSGGATAYATTSGSSGGSSGGGSSGGSGGGVGNVNVRGVAAAETGLLSVGAAVGAGAEAARKGQAVRKGKQRGNSSSSNSSSSRGAGGGGVEGAKAAAVAAAKAAGVPRAAGADAARWRGSAEPAAAGGGKGDGGRGGRAKRPAAAVFLEAGGTTTVIA